MCPRSVHGVQWDARRDLPDQRHVDCFGVGPQGGIRGLDGRASLPSASCRTLFLPPSGVFAANAAWLAVAAIAHNLPRAADALASLPFAKARAATIRRDLIAVAARAARHGRGHLTLHLPEARHREQEWLNLLGAACRSGLTSPELVCTPTAATATPNPPSPAREPRTSRRKGGQREARAPAHPGKLIVQKPTEDRVP